MTSDRSVEYTKAGVDIDAAVSWVSKIKQMAEQTRDAGVLSGVGGFSGLYSLEHLGYENLVLASGADGVGTKVIIAQMMDKHDTVGIDLVAMNVDDVVTSGATPLLFLDYIAGGRLTPDLVEQIVEGVVAGCQAAGCVLLGGETAQMPDLYGPGEYDLAGFCVGIADQSKLIDGKTIRHGDVVIGLASSGLHSNGYTLARKVFREAGWDLSRHVAEFGRSLGEELLEPTRIYAPLLLKIRDSVCLKGAAHITGGGIVENVPRIMAPGLKVEFDFSWEVPPVFQLIQELGKISDMEMYRVFNMGIGMAVVVGKDDVDKVIGLCRETGIASFVAGEVVGEPV
jgi:phosphoribosylformylglycinamidine cyclo-ligase